VQLECLTTIDPKVVIDAVREQLKKVRGSRFEGEENDSKRFDVRRSTFEVGKRGARRWNSLIENLQHLHIQRRTSNLERRNPAPACNLEPRTPNLETRLSDFEKSFRKGTRLICDGGAALWPYLSSGWPA
jgi:hypothetical protein